MKCPYCGSPDSRVVDTREVGDGIRRRRECQGCLQRYTTYEQVAKAHLLIVKRDGRREPFDRQKLYEGIWKACAKRPVSAKQWTNWWARSRRTCTASANPRCPAACWAEMVMERLRDLDGVAYVRFASVYRSFADLETLQREVDEMIRRGSSPA
jgi:transcriptional repressor NrdR